MQRSVVGVVVAEPCRVDGTLIESCMLMRRSKDVLVKGYACGVEPLANWPFDLLPSKITSENTSEKAIRVLILY